MSSTMSSLDADLGRGDPTALRVLLIDASDRGGIARYTSKLREALVDQGTTVFLAAPVECGDTGLELPLHRWGPDVAKMSKMRLYRLRLAELGPSAYAFVRAVRRARPDIVHVQTEVVPRFDHLILRHLSRTVPVVLTAHGPLPDGGARELVIQARRWRAADAVIIHAEEPRRLVESCAPGVPVYVVPVDLRLGGPSVPKETARRRMDVPAVPTALLLGQVRPYKGTSLIAKAWPGVIAAVPHARLLVVGEPFDDGRLDGLVGLEGVEVRRGFIPEADMDVWAAAADVLLLPYHHGSHSGILHRGLSAGTPVLASPSLAEETYRTGAGRVVPLAVQEWTEALIAALSHDPMPRPSVPTGCLTAAGTLAVYRNVLECRS